MTETILEPDLPIVDPHHHLWDLRPLLPAFPTPRHPFLEAIAGAAYYDFDALRADIGGGSPDAPSHRVLATVFMECGAYYAADREQAMKPPGRAIAIGAASPANAMSADKPDPLVM